MNKINAAIFDMDGVLINTEPMHYRMWKEAFSHRGLNISYDVYKGCIGATHDYLMELIWKNYHIDFRNDVLIGEEALEIKMKMIREEGFPVIEGVSDMLRILSDNGYKLAIASSSPIKYIELAMQYIGVRDYFDVINSGQFVEHSKPAPDIYLDTAHKLNCRVEECLVLEDSMNGCIAATDAGMLCVGYYNPDSGEQDLSRACCVINQLSLFNPHLIHSIENKNFME